jgi:hypothetical protein
MVRLLISLIISILLLRIGLSQKTSSYELIADRDQQVVSGLTASADPIKPDKISVSDFGAIPGDGKDDSEAIQAAIEQARADGIRKVFFEAGTYEFKMIPGWERTERKRSCYITIKDISDLQV